jgi:hypothetical protein
LGQAKSTGWNKVCVEVDNSGEAGGGRGELQAS